MLQETLKELFPSWEAVKRYREVVLFVVGLMKDPRPLVQHIYEMKVEDYLNQMRTHDYVTMDTNLFKSLHTESTVRLVSDPLHNKYINYYNHESFGYDPNDTTPVYYPSRLYVFEDVRHKVVLDHHTDGEEIPPCAMYIWSLDEAVTDSLLSICSEIWKYQAVSDLRMDPVICTDSTLDPPRMANPRCLALRDCQFPGPFIRKLLHQLFDCSESLEMLWLSRMNLEPFERNLDELLENLVAHHEAGLAQRKLEILLIGGKHIQLTNLSREFKKKWRKRCEKVDSIHCKIP